MTDFGENQQACKVLNLAAEPRQTLFNEISARIREREAERSRSVRSSIRKRNATFVDQKVEAPGQANVLVREAAPAALVTVTVTESRRPAG